MNFKVDILCKAFPGKSTISALGWSNVVLIRTKDKNILFDTGAQGIRPNILRALGKLSIEPNQIDSVFLSHLHFDHCGNASLFPNASFIISETEWKYATTEEDIFTTEESVKYLRDRKKIIISEDGDEVYPGMKAVFTPGHTPGGMSLVLEADGEKWIIAGDAVKNRVELLREKVDMSLNNEQSRQSICRIKGIADRVLPGHDCWMKIENGKIIPEEKVQVDITLPKGMQDGKNGVFKLVIENRPLV
ncbi:N-acyl homoserine lactonase family protein [Clostridium luticellarii]|jgi:glyoxylase-like metal-dependent hydrolase (beta-lactamase superfamily II)|uniref:N-acyl homoserine lactonase family protein n=1 Tax=Clostridium luticellarii TaxID=1691940 RepID=UPI0023546539|nr:N-acyl homoserine lactonase family protein [Clostridium luticellarii]MCI1945208.1 N-acyl homoserine lactonase family protein [Clostridium luticellarii]MCI1968830.1 N-acyl homoserine lactonase family protein [Clostridium luticellarii]MCI1995616.1 N-acyl homoserine lactonase family protein [Clostridium luticellarii]MCI2040004.1 N-acyl homoserine lactonase family protein [Clostridium luticellarii]